MSDQTNIKLEGDLLIVRVLGEFSVTRSKKLLSFLFMKCREENISKMLIDVREMGGTISVFDKFTLGDMMQEFQTSFVRIAFLVREDHQKPQKVFETVANNRGAFVFTTTVDNEAYKWFESLPVKTGSE